MKAHDVELMVGIPKQTLLYYEKEGLITVARDDNNYRNYSQNNIEILKLIKLLREMEISIDEIKLILDNKLSIREALEKKKEFIEHNKIELDNIDQKINDYIKRNRVKVSFNNQSITNWVDKETLFCNQRSIDYNGIKIMIDEIKEIDLSMCSELRPLDIIRVYLNYYVDIDIRTSYDTYSFQILNNDSIVMLFKYFKKNNLKINDPLDLVTLYQNKDAVALNKYLDIHFKKWAKKYHLDNPRNTDSLFSWFKKDDEN